MTRKVGVFEYFIQSHEDVQDYHEVVYAVVKINLLGERQTVALFEAKQQALNFLDMLGSD
jgi:hypothetical protein